MLLEMMGWLKVVVVIRTSQERHMLLAGFSERGGASLGSQVR